MERREVLPAVDAMADARQNFPCSHMRRAARPGRDLNRRASTCGYPLLWLHSPWTDRFAALRVGFRHTYCSISWVSTALESLGEIEGFLFHDDVLSRFVVSRTQHTHFVICLGSIEWNNHEKNLPWDILCYAYVHVLLNRNYYHFCKLKTG